MHKNPNQLGGEAPQLEPPHVDHRRVMANHRQIAHIVVVEGRHLFSLKPLLNWLKLTLISFSVSIQKGLVVFSIFHHDFQTENS